jgi:hypothetical protein
VTRSTTRWDPWALLTLILLWLPFFAAGLLPEDTFYGLRVLGRVTTQQAMVNSPGMITAGLAAYLTYFAYHRCREAGLSGPPLRARTIQIGVLALVAFVPYPFGLLLAPGSVGLPSIAEAGQLAAFFAVFGLPLAKLVAWAYLLLMIALYHARGNRHVFATFLSNVSTEGSSEDTPDS